MDTVLTSLLYYDTIYEEKKTQYQEGSRLRMQGQMKIVFQRIMAQLLTDKLTKEMRK